MNFTSFHAAKEFLRVKASGSEFVQLVHDATSEEPWGPTGAQMDDICLAFPRGASKIMDEINLRLKNREKSWRACYKSLLVIDHLARNISDSDLPALRSVLPTVQLISQTFYYTGRSGTDHGLSVRERARKLCDLLSDTNVLRDERRKAMATRNKLSISSAGCGPFGGQSASCNDGFSSGNGSSHNFSTRIGTNFSRSREEQEREDMELAAKLQREEELRSGVTVADVERTFHQDKGRTGSTVKTSTVDADAILARRLQEEEERLRYAQNTVGKAEATSTLNTNCARASETNRPKNEAPKADLLEDLFAPAASAPPASSESLKQPASHTQQQATTDIFAFTNASAPQQQFFGQQQPEQQQFQGMQPAVAGFPQMGIPPQQYPIVGAAQGWGMGAPPPSQLAQHPGMPQVPAQGQTTAWFGPGQPQAWSGGMQPHGAMAAPPGNSGTFGPFATQVPAPLGAVPDSRSATLQSGGGNASHTMNTMEQQIAQFSGNFSGQASKPPMSLDGLMAERRGGY
ncbi:ENTH domain [Trypanosoma vivax]|uniref:Putative epsin n=1 Tax=Trypanosoma vivax (strain Y486) TaxID=1055687 RepID=G0U9T5_TRYVY|nr:putative epsin [Trypanosoma vivax]KAH8619118.1 ENTH domain [Trypanosoma vivax]CCC52566.1 putative epsin [Trypanosoma vivax Y486]